MRASFNYEYLGKGKFGQLSRPVAKVSFLSKEGKWIEFSMVVDTGADFSILPRYIARILKISLETDCVEDETIGIGGEQKIYFLKQKIKVKIGNMEREVPIAFFANNDVPPLLGRLGFLEIFETTFVKNKKLVFKE